LEALTMAKPPATLPDGWTRFVTDVAEGMDPADAAKALGFPNPAAVAAELLRRPDVRKALAQTTEAMLECEAVPLALGVVREILTDRDPKARAVRAKLAIAVLDRTKSKDEKAPPADPAQMDATQLEQLVAQLQGLGVRPGQMLNITPDTKAKVEQ
jgi:hypothetical protein